MTDGEFYLRATGWMMLSIIVYVIPMYVAIKRRHRDQLPIIALNLLLGWTFLVWVICLVWALTDRVHPRRYRA